MLVVSTEAPTSGAYIWQLIGTFAEKLDIDILVGSWKTLASRHEILREHFIFDTTRGWDQVIYDDPEIFIDVEDWNEYPDGQQRTFFETFLEEDRERGFLFDGELPYRVKVIQFKKNLFRMVWTFHHVLLDGRTHIALIKELLAIYDARLDLVGLDLESPARYRDYLDWLQLSDFSSSRDFWRSALNGAERINTELKSRPRRRIFASDSKLIDIEIELSGVTTSEMSKTASRYGVTVNTLTLAAWSLLLSCYTDSNEILLGVVRSCRRSLPMRLRTVRGLVINTVPLRIQIDGSQLISAWLKQIRDDWVELRSHELCSVSEIRRWCDWPAGKPMFSSIHVYDHNDSSVLDCSDPISRVNREFRLIHGRTEAALSVSNTGGPNFRAVIQADSEIFTPAEVDQLGDRYVYLLEQLTDLSDRNLESFDTLTALERQKIESFNKCVRPANQSGTILDIFLHQVRSEPSLPALVGNNITISYQQLCAASRDLSHALDAAAPIAPVGILIGSRPEFTIALFASLMSGVGFVPLDPDYPDERTEFMLKDCGSTIVITIPDSRGKAIRIFESSGRQGSILTIDIQSLPTSEKIKINATEVKGDRLSRQTESIEELVYIVYTSGTTGEPKGVPITSNNLMPLMRWQQEQFELGTNTRTIQTLSVSFDFGLQEIFTTLLFGGVLFCPGKSVLLDPMKYVNFIKRNSINMVYITPSFLEAILPANPDLDTLKVLLLGGERLRWSTIERLRDSVKPKCKIFNGYGPTEATINCSMYKIELGDDELGRHGSSVPIGRPSGLSRLYVLDSLQRQVPIGVPGELYIGGPGVAQGYLKRPELTEQKFISDKFSDQTSSRLYRTGDKVVLHSDSNLEFLGRSDNQIKFRGHRIELEEIDAVLSQDPRVLSAATTIKKTTGGDLNLHAFVVPAAENVRADDIKSVARERLPPFMVPAKIWVLDSLPTTETGKVNRSALQSPENKESNLLPERTRNRRVDRAPFDQWFYDPVWRETPIDSKAEGDKANQQRGTWLIFFDNNTLGRRLPRRLIALGENTVTVSPSKAFLKSESTHYNIDPNSPSDYQRIFADLIDTNRKPSKVVFVDRAESRVKDSSYNSDERLNRLLYLLQAIGKFYRTHSLSFSVITVNAHSVTGEEALSPRGALLYGMCKSLPYEIPSVRWNNIDVDDQYLNTDECVDQLIIELRRDCSGEFVAYRNCLRYILGFDKITPAVGNLETTIGTEGCYLITGGAGAIGLELGEALVQKGAKYLAILDMPQQISTKRSAINKRFQRIIDRGGKILCIGVDICDQSQVSSAIKTVREAFGRIHGVIHTAGIAETKIIQNLQWEKVERVIGPKVWGTEILSSALEEDSPDFVLLCSSIDAIRGSYGQADYCAANAFLDAFSHHMRTKGQRYTSINWDVWQKVGMATRVDVPLSMGEQWRQELTLGITPSEGRYIFQRSLYLDKAQLTISTTDLESRVGQFPLFVNPSDPDQTKQEPIGKLTGSIEDKILKIFKNVLDDSGLELEDDFFLKGGDSLMAMRVTSMINNHYGIKIPISSLFEASTAASLSKILQEDLYDSGTD